MTVVSYDVRKFEEPAKYDRLVELESTSVWWDVQGPLGGLHLLNEHAAQQGLDIDYRVADAETFETDERFDAVMAVDVLEHVEDLDATLAACAREDRRS